MKEDRNGLGFYLVGAVLFLFYLISFIFDRNVGNRRDVLD